MTFIKPFLSARTKVGLAIEDTQGVFQSPLFWLPVTSAKLENDRKYYTDKSFRGRAAESYGHYRLTATGTAEYAGPFYPDSMSPLILSAFGQDKITTAGDAVAAVASDLSGAVIATATSLVLDSGAGLSNGDLVSVGPDASGAKEIVRAGTVVGATLTLDYGVKFAHADESPVKLVPGTTITVNIAAGDTSLTVQTGEGADYIPYEAIMVGTDSNNTEGNIVKSVSGDIITCYLPFRFAHDKTKPGQNVVSGNNLHDFRFAPNDRSDASIGGNSNIPAGNTAVPHLSILDKTDVFQKQVRGSTVEEINIKWAAGTEVTYTVKLRGAVLEDSTDSTATLFTRKAPFTGWQAGLFTDGTLDGAIEDMDVTIKRKVEVIHAGNNQDSPVAIFAGVASITGKLMVVYRDSAEYDKYENQTNPAIMLALVGFAKGELGNHSASGMVLKMSNTAWVKAPIERGKDYVQIAINFEADDAVDLSSDTLTDGGGNLTSPPSHNGSDDDGPGELFLTNNLSTLLHA